MAKNTKIQLITEYCYLSGLIGWFRVHQIGGLALYSRDYLNSELHI